MVITPYWDIMQLHPRSWNSSRADAVHSEPSIYFRSEQTQTVNTRSTIPLQTQLRLFLKCNKGEQSASVETVEGVWNAGSSKMGETVEARRA